MSMFGKAKEMVADAKDKVAGMADAAKDAVTTKVTIVVIDVVNMSCENLELKLQDLANKSKTIEISSVGNACIVKVTN